jgi:hypothetical protein
VALTKTGAATQVTEISENVSLQFSRMPQYNLLTGMIPGIHEFEPTLSWSPDSVHVALIDCVYDWTANNQELAHGKESNRRCSIAIVSRSGKLKLVPLANSSSSDLYRARLQWSNSRQLILQIDGFSRTIDLP